MADKVIKGVVVDRDGNPAYAEGISPDDKYQDANGNNRSALGAEAKMVAKWTKVD